MKTRPSGDGGRSVTALLVVIYATLTAQTTSSKTLRGAPIFEGVLDVPTIDASLLASANDNGFNAPASSSDRGGDASGDSSFLVLEAPPPPLTPDLPKEPGHDHPYQQEALVREFSGNTNAAEADGPKSLTNDDPSLLQGRRHGAAAGAAQRRAEESEADSASAGNSGNDAVNEEALSARQLDALSNGLDETASEDDEAMRKFSAELGGMKAVRLDGEREALDTRVAQEDDELARTDGAEVKRLEQHLEQRFVAVHKHTNTLRRQLHEALLKDQVLEGQLNGAKGVISTQQSRLQKITKKAKEIATALTAEWSSERELKWKLSNATMANKDKDHKLEGVQHQLRNVERKLSKEMRADNTAEVEKKSETEVILSEQKQLKASQQLAAKLNKRAKVAEAKNTKLQHEVSSDKQEISKTSSVAIMLQQQVAALQAQLNAAKADNAQKDKALKYQIEQRESLEGKVVSDQDHLESLRGELQKERVTTKTREGILTQELGLHSEAGETEREWDEDLRQHVSALHNGIRIATQNLTQQLEMEQGKEYQVVKEKSSMEHELAKNIRQKKKLAKEVTLLRQRIVRGDKAREAVEKQANSVAKQLVQAQAVNRQLEGTVPQLLEQSRLAREAQDAAKLMRSQAQQAMVKYSKKHAVDSDLSELAKLVGGVSDDQEPSQSAAAAPQAKDMDINLGGTPMVADAMVGVSLDEDAQPKSSDASTSSDAQTGSTAAAEASVDAFS